MKLLLIEDDEALCELLIFQLEKENYEVDVCHDGRDGLDLFLQDAYDLVLLDRMLPTMNGLLVLKKARKAGVTTPVILITALGELYDRIEGTGRFAVDTAADTVVVEPADDWVDLYLPSNVAVATDADYPQLYANLISWESDTGVTTDENGTVTVRVGGEVLTTIAGDELVRRQLERNAWSFDRLSGLDEAARGRLLDYRDERVRILFSNLEIGRSDSTTYRLLGATAELFWTR